ncbi:MAG: HAMP domain-containing protein [Clostridiales bacterium]|jgi:two-component system OmpR family sensor kinase|nr:HAMP domain-containing protein [Clostridiales bacterium]HOC07902.1 HAMP domain-containing sensor histidine kinase [Bacillota bacterium]HQD41712.1 HAMP domain-containing sensor histidine kinase [Bacillota bacterium]
MFNSLRTRLMVVYTLIIFITIAAVDVLILSDYFRSRLQERTITYFTYGNIAANLVSANSSDVFYISRTLEQYTQTTGARFLLIDSRSVVVSDGANHYTGELLTNPQVRKALSGSSSWAVYDNGGKNLQLAVPVTTGGRDSLEVVGAVLISADIGDLYDSYRSLRWRVILTSLLAGLMGMLFSFAAAHHLSRPLHKLIAFSKRLSRGRLGEQVNIKRNDEIGQLADTINIMSADLHRIEQNRRRFIGDVSHELKTPLASIKALVEALLMGSNAPEEKYREFLEDVIGEVDRLSMLISRLLTYTRLEEERLKREYLTLSDIAADTVRIMTPLAASHNVILENKARMDIRVPCDKNLVREMLVNVIDNSIKYRDRAKAVNKIEITDGRTFDTYRLEISDNGIGIAEQDLSRIFEGFYRSEPSRSREIEGYGMGLSIVKRIADLHGWDVSAKSQPGRGTTIVLSIPLQFK